MNKLKNSIFALIITFSTQSIADVYIDKAKPNTPIDLNLPIHKKPKTNPEFYDPVLGDQAEINEWSWNKEYAKLANLDVTKSEIADENLLLIGIKVKREQSGKWQRYTCTISGIIKKELPISLPDFDVYTDEVRNKSLPNNTINNIFNYNKNDSLTQYTPQWVVRFKNNKLYRLGSVNYKFLNKSSSDKFNYFELNTYCGNFNNPDSFNNAIQFPLSSTKNIQIYIKDRLIEYQIPIELMKRIYPYLLEATDWTSCLMRRVGSERNVLTIRSTKYNKFGNACDNKNVTYKNQLHIEKAN